MYNDFQWRGVSVINIHSHDRNVSVNRAIRPKNVWNCNDRRHATKPIAQGIKKILSGAKKNIGRTWHPELADKGSRIRNHMYYITDHCGGDPLVLQSIIDKSIPHREENNVPDFTVIREQISVKLPTEFLHTLILYINAADYVLFMLRALTIRP